ncbi:MAG: four helix bundle protein [Planctomycetota bacterium]
MLSIRSGGVRLAGYRDLEVWQAAMELVEEVYALTTAFPDEEKFGLVSQLRRAAVSVPSNIAEGHGRQSQGDMGRFASIARGSLSELETQVILAQRLGLSDDFATKQILDQADEVGRMLGGLIRSTRKP